MEISLFPRFVKGELAFAERIHEVIMGEVENSTGFEQTK
jgi:hypothetical protein